jgi:argininosuccinate lyase
VRHALDQDKRLSELTPEELARFTDRLDDEYYAVLANGSWLESKVSEGGTASARVREQLDRARAILEETKA